VQPQHAQPLSTDGRQLAPLAGGVEEQRIIAIADITGTPAVRRLVVQAVQIPVGEPLALEPSWSSAFRRCRPKTA
jgi:hypothetical protein